MAVSSGSDWVGSGSKLGQVGIRVRLPDQDDINKLIAIKAQVVRVSETITCKINNEES